MSYSRREQLFLATRIKLLRNESDLTQAQLAEKVSEIMHRDKPYNYLVVSMWENNRRSPNQQALIALGVLFNVSVDYLLGRTDARTEVVPKNVTISSPLVDGNVIPIKYTDLSDYHEKPIYCVFPNKTRRDGWCLLDYRNNRLLFIDCTLPASPDNLYYKNEALTNVNTLVMLQRPISMEQMLESKNVWVEMLSHDPAIKAMYSGWYAHNQNHSCLINIIGLTLPYEGLNKSYRAYDNSDI